MAYGTPTDPVGGTVITVAYAVANLLDPIRWLRALTGGADPPGTNYVVRSTSTSATEWSKVTSDMIAALTGQLSFGAVAGISFYGNGGSARSSVRDYAAQGLVFNVHGDSFEIYDQALANQMFQAYRSGGVAYGKIGGNVIWHTGNDGPGGGLDADTLDGVQGSGYAVAPAALAARGTSLALTTSYQDVPSASVTATATGTYLVMAAVKFNSTSTDGNNRASVYVNGVAVSTAEMVGSTGTTQINHPSCMFLTSITSGHVVKIQAKKDSGSGGSSADDAYLAIVRVV